MAFHLGQRPPFIQAVLQIICVRNRRPTLHNINEVFNVVILKIPSPSSIYLLNWLEIIKIMIYISWHRILVWQVASFV